MSDENFARIEEAHNPQNAITIITDILSKGHSPEPTLQLISQLSQPANTIPATGSSEGQQAANSEAGQSSE